jgi:AcrR family transcriptional regulator
MRETVIRSGGRNMNAKEEKRQEIAAIASGLFSEFGYKSVSMDQISQSAQVAKGTLYLYFKDKEDLLTYLVKGVRAGIREMAVEIEARGLPFLEEIHEVVYSFLMYRQNQKFIYKIMREAKELKTPSACRAIKQMDDEVSGYLEKRLRSAMDQGIIRQANTTILSYVIIKVYTALAFEWEEEHEKLNEKQISESVALFLKDGLILK